jgi:hypothetical protein
MEAGDWREAPKAPSRRTKAPVKDLGKTYVIFDKLRRDGRDSVWAYVARNLSRPLAFSAARFLRCVRRRFICVQAASSVLPNRRQCESFEFRHAGLAFTLCAGFYQWVLGHGG